MVSSPSGFGDLGYNDIILTGLEESRKRLSFDVVMHVPASVVVGITFDPERRTIGDWMVES